MEKRDLIGVREAMAQVLSMLNSMESKIIGNLDGLDKRVDEIECDIILFQSSLGHE